VVLLQDLQEMLDRRVRAKSHNPVAFSAYHV